jgi:hypothetical protein
MYAMVSGDVERRDERFARSDRVGSSSRLNFWERSSRLGGEGRMRTRASKRRDTKPTLNLPSSLERKLTRMGLGGHLAPEKRFLTPFSPAIPGPGQQTCAPASTVQDANGNITSTASTCTGSIPVPLGYVNWGFCGDAINTVPSQNANNQQWILSCGGPSPATPAVQSSSSYPTWTSTVTNRK